MNATADASSIADLISSIGQRKSVSSVPPVAQEVPPPAVANGRNGIAYPVDADWLLSALWGPLSGGVAVVDANFTLLYSNPAAESMIVRPHFTRHGRFVFNERDINSARFRGAIQQALSGERLMAPYPDGESRRLIGFSPLRLPDDKPAALITVERKPIVQPGALAAYAEMIGLTRREVAVLGALAEGAQPREVAQSLGIAVETVRTHIRALLNKARVGGLREIVIQVAGLPPVG